MSASTGITTLAANSALVFGFPSTQVSSILLAISGVAIGAAGLGLIALCIRTLLRQPLQAALDAVDLDSMPMPMGPALAPVFAEEEAPLSDLPPTVIVEPVRPTMPAAVASVPQAYLPEPAAVAPPHVDSTAEMDKGMLRALADSITDEAEPPTSRTPHVGAEEPAETTRQRGAGDTDAFWPLVSLKPVSVMPETAETPLESTLIPPSEPANANGAPRRSPSSSGLVATPSPRDLASFQYGARRA